MHSTAVLEQQLQNFSALFILSAGGQYFQGVLILRGGCGYNKSYGSNNFINAILFQLLHNCNLHNVMIDNHCIDGLILWKSRQSYQNTWKWVIGLWDNKLISKTAHIPQMWKRGFTSLCSCVSLGTGGEGNDYIFLGHSLSLLQVAFISSFFSANAELQPLLELFSTARIVCGYALFGKVNCTL